MRCRGPVARLEAHARRRRDEEPRRGLRRPRDLEPAARRALGLLDLVVAEDGEDLGHELGRVRDGVDGLACQGPRRRDAERAEADALGGPGRAARDAVGEEGACFMRAARCAGGDHGFGACNAIFGFQPNFRLATGRGACVLALWYRP